MLIKDYTFFIDYFSMPLFLFNREEKKNCQKTPQNFLISEKIFFSSFCNTIKIQEGLNEQRIAG